MIGCGVATGWGAAMNNTHVEPGSTVAVWGLGAVDLLSSTLLRSKALERSLPLTSTNRSSTSPRVGADVCYKPTPEKSAKTWLLEQEKWGINFTYDCTGNVLVMREALETAHRGYG
jgi:S-(hydroxymethyl)glutathione dehydrogenase/alcohol dehydrogenase